VNDLLEAWLRRLNDDKLLSAKPEAMAALLGAWLAQLEPAAAGDAASAHELMKQLAFHARELGLEGRTASLAQLQILALDDLLLSRSAALGAGLAPLRRVVREATLVVADAHALGLAERLRAGHHRQIRDFTPIVRVAEDVVLGFLLGPMSADLIDAAVGGLLRAAASAGARTAILDIFGAGPEDQRFYRTIESMLAANTRIRFVLTGLPDPARTQAALAALGIDLSRITFEPRLNEYLERTRSSQH
jgi:hypothetical protein